MKQRSPSSPEVMTVDASLSWDRQTQGSTSTVNAASLVSWAANEQFRHPAPRQTAERDERGEERMGKGGQLFISGAPCYAEE